MSDAPEPGYYERLDFNAPLSGARADMIAAELAAVGPGTVLDVGCGWGELLLRTLAAAPGATGRGVDSDRRALARGRANAVSRGIDGRVAFEAGEARRGRRAAGDAGEAAVSREPADVVICVGADHAFGDQRAALAALHGLVRPGGLVLFGSGFWSVEPSVEQAAAVGMTPESLPDLAGLVDLAIGQGFRPLTIQTANADEWAQFESGYPGRLGAPGCSPRRPARRRRHSSEGRRPPQRVAARLSRRARVRLSHAGVAGAGQVTVP